MRLFLEHNDTRVSFIPIITAVIVIAQDSLLKKNNTYFWENVVGVVADRSLSQGLKQNEGRTLSPPQGQASRHAQTMKWIYTYIHVTQANMHKSN